MPSVWVTDVIQGAKGKAMDLYFMPCFSKCWASNDKNIGQVDGRVAVNLEGTLWI